MMVAAGSALSNGNSTAAASSASYPQDVGIVAMEVYFPKKCVDQADLERFDGVSAGKYTIGLGQTKMAFCDDREDINSICLTVVHNLLEKYNISPNDIGRLEVGTETIIDKSKSVKTILMQLFASSGNTDIEGIDTTNACYGGTNALFNSINWIESSSWDGRYALVVAGDIAVYASGNARPTGGAGVVAMLLGKDAPIVIDRGLRSTHMEHAWDFYKPNLSSEFPEVDGALSISCYLKAVDSCYARYGAKLAAVNAAVENGNAAAPASLPTINDLDFVVFHSPFTKLVQKSYARMAFNDFLRSAPSTNNPDEMTDAEKSLEAMRGLRLEETYFNKEVEKAFLNQTKQSFADRVVPSLLLAKQLGNTYCGSVYGCLASLICDKADDLIGKRAVLFSYGSGFAASMFSFTVKRPVSHIVAVLNLQARLKARAVVAPEEFEKAMQLREETHNLKNYTPVSPADTKAMWPGTYYLEHVDGMFRREYKRVESA